MLKSTCVMLVLIVGACTTERRPIELTARLVGETSAIALIYDVANHGSEDVCVPPPIAFAQRDVHAGSIGYFWVDSGPQEIHWQQPVYGEDGGLDLGVVHPGDIRRFEIRALRFSGPINIDETEWGANLIVASCDGLSVVSEDTRHWDGATPLNRLGDFAGGSTGDAQTTLHNQ
jgi:hypothetical protein